jgi:predicted DsbA family dithiol-disulfide isomerase
MTFAAHPADVSREGPPARPHPIHVDPHTIVVYSDLSCAFAHVCVHRLLQARDEMGAPVRLIHRHFVLEEVNRFPIPKHFLDSEVPQIAPIDIDAGWRVWTEPAETWPVSTLLAMEAVRAVEEQGPDAHEQLDRALRLAFFRDHRCITLRHVILDVAAACPAIDPERLALALDSGRCRADLISDHRLALDVVQGSPHLFLPDGSDVHNPGVEVSWLGEQGTGYPRIDAWDPSVHASLIRRAMS